MLMNLITRAWKTYISWCDRMGLTPENRRSCAPRLSEPSLTSVKAHSKEKESKSKDVGTYDANNR
ncbi:hypothetical protein [Shewanella sp. UCD-KL12]|uniref:hypothetical protein n=1 Tax=Shewanella sp. UCD-KL12 TaxID=1917163 RepID=UPI000970F4FB|nr:hypothetical protein [Shewanella sp. UCD-KL12]